MLQRGPHPLPAFLSMLQRETAGDMTRLAAALEGVRTYQRSPFRRDLPDMPVIAQSGSACLRDYGGSGPTVVVVPSLLNPWHVLDIRADHSMLRWLTAQGLHVLLLDWGRPEAAECRMGLAAYVGQRLLALLATLSAPPRLAGYCLGGTLAIAAANIAPVERLALIATPWDFSGYDAERRADAATLWQAMAPAAWRDGCLPMDLLQPGFWSLDTKATIDKFVRLASLDPKADAVRDFTLVEDWSNSGPPIGAAAARDMFEDLMIANLPGENRWFARLDAVRCPVQSFYAPADKLVPAGSIPALGNRIAIDAGHVGMIVGSRAKTQLWEPLAAFLGG